MDRDTEDAILEFVLQESAELERHRTEMIQEERRRIIAQQDEEYKASLELDQKKVGEEVGEAADEPKEGDIKALREARLKYFKIN